MCVAPPLQTEELDETLDSNVHLPRKRAICALHPVAERVLLIGVWVSTRCRVEETLMRLLNGLRIIRGCVCRVVRCFGKSVIIVVNAFGLELVDITADD